MFYNSDLKQTACIKQLSLMASVVLISLRNFNLASEECLLKGACGVEVKEVRPPGRGGGPSDIFEQHRDHVKIFASGMEVKNLKNRTT